MKVMNEGLDACHASEADVCSHLLTCAHLIAHKHITDGLDTLVAVTAHLISSRLNSKLIKLFSVCVINEWLEYSFGMRYALRC